MRLFLLLSLFTLAAAALPGNTPAQNSFVDVNTKVDISRTEYSVTQDASGSLGINGVCRYDRTVSPPELKINEDYFDHSNVLFGVADPGECPMPGSKILNNYPNSLAGEFLFSGVICIVNSIILDSMFRVYCTLILWMYQIIYAVMIIYIMFYGLTIMLGLSADALKEAPKRIIKIILIFMLAANAQMGFKFIHQGFINFLNTFTEMLTELQPLYDEGGEAAYDDKGKLLNINGDPWKPVAQGTKYYDMEKIEQYAAFAQPSPLTPKQVEEQIADGTIQPSTIEEQASGLQTVEPKDYVPFRIPTMQWEIQTEEVNGKEELELYQVYEEVTHNAGIPEDLLACVLDVQWNPVRKRLEKYPRCQKNRWPTVPNVAPFGQYCLYFDDMTPACNSASAGCGAPNPDPSICEQHFTPILVPPRLKRVDGNTTEKCNPLFYWTCRKPFQGVMGKIDAMFNSVVGDDNAKSIGAMAMALGLWGAGGGTFLSILLMSGVATMFIAFIQLLWTYITAIMALTFLMMLSPIFLSFAMFKVTERMFKSWLSSLISYAMQPFLIMTFIYVLSNVTSLDRLTELAKHEVGNKTYMISASEEKAGGKLIAPGFLEPLYEKPDDFERVHFSDATISADNNSSNDNFIYINGKVRDQYIDMKGKMIRNRNIANAVGNGVTIENFHTQASKDEIARSKYANDLVALWDGGKYPNSTETTGSRGIQAIIDYRQSQGTNIYGDLVTAYKNELGIDDKDSYIGEPVTRDGTGITSGEYPECILYCPGFDPPWDATTNPNPLVTTEDTVPTGYTKVECKKFCMYLTNSMDDRFQYLMGGVIIWIVLNVITGAFMTRVPLLAKQLSLWSPYARPEVLGGASQVYHEGKYSLYSTQEKSGMYHVGGLFDFGIMSGRAGSIPAAFDKIARTMMGPKKSVDPSTGRIIEEDRKPYTEYGGLLSEKPKSPWERAEVVQIVEEYRKKMGLDNTAATFNADARYQGISHNRIWEMIKKSVADNATGNAATLRRSIQDQIDAELKQKAMDGMKNFKGKY